MCVFGRAGKDQLVDVVCRGGSQAIIDLLVGHLNVGPMIFSTTRQYIESGKLTAFAVSTKTAWRSSRTCRR